MIDVDRIPNRACADASVQDDPEGVADRSPVKSERRGLVEAEGTLGATLAIEEAAAATAKEEEAALAKELEVSGPRGYIVDSAYHVHHMTWYCIQKLRISRGGGGYHVLAWGMT
jgi:hypothetical protein